MLTRWNGFLSIVKDSSRASRVSGDSLTLLKPGSIIQVGDYSPKVVLSVNTEVVPNVIRLTTPWLNNTITNQRALSVRIPIDTGELVTKVTDYVKSQERFTELNAPHLPDVALSRDPTISIDDRILGIIDDIIPLGYVKDQYQTILQHNLDALHTDVAGNLSLSTKRYHQHHIAPYLRLLYNYQSGRFVQLGEYGELGDVGSPNLNNLISSVWFDSYRGTFIVQICKEDLSIGNDVISLDAEVPLTVRYTSANTLALLVDGGVVDTFDSSHLVDIDMLSLCVTYENHKVGIYVNGVEFTLYANKEHPIMSANVHNRTIELSYHAVYLNDNQAKALTR